MRVGLDTSVVLRLLVGEPKDQAHAARTFVSDHWSAGLGAVRVCDLVVAEAYFALRHHYHVPDNEATGAIEALLTDRRIGASVGALRAVRSHLAAEAGPGLTDRLIHEHYGSESAAYATFDIMAGRLPGAILLAT